MSKNITSFFKKIFLSSVAGIAAANSNVAEAKNIELIHSEGIKEITETSFTIKRNLEKKFLLKLNSNLEWEYSTHRSHRSHSSHRSHYSHYSSSTGSSGSGSSGSSSGGSGRTGSSSGSSGYTNGSYILSNPTSTTTKVYRLGERTLKRGMSGRDVTELVNILIQKGYIEMLDGSTSVSGIQTYDKVVESAIKQYQVNKDLDADGITGPTTIYYLKNF